MRTEVCTQRSSERAEVHRAGLTRLVRVGTHTLGNHSHLYHWFYWSPVKNKARENGLLQFDLEMGFGLAQSLHISSTPDSMFYQAREVEKVAAR